MKSNVYRLMSFGLAAVLALAATAAGADGIMIEVHNDPAHALCDGPQALTPEQFADVVSECNAIRDILNK